MSETSPGATVPWSPGEGPPWKKLAHEDIVKIDHAPAATTSEERQLLTIVAELAWCEFDVTELSYIAKAHQIDVRGSTLLCYLVDMTMFALHIDELAALDLLKDRVAHLQLDEEWDLIMEIDEAQQVLAKDDVDEVQKEQKTNNAAKTKFHTFCNEFRDRKQRARAASGGGGGGGGSGRGAGAAAKRPPRHLRDCDFSQAAGKAFMPPGGALWQDRNKGLKLARVPPMKPARGKWENGGPNAAQCTVIKAAWRQYCVLEGIPESQCPMGGVFEQGLGHSIAGVKPQAAPGAAIVAGTALVAVPVD